MIVWSGMGILVVVIAVGCSAIANLIVNSITGSSAYWNAHKWPLGISLLVSGTICWLLGKYLDGRGGRILLDPKTGREVLIKKRHTLFLISVRWWGPILAAGALAAFVAEFAK